MRAPIIAGSWILILAGFAVAQVPGVPGVGGVGAAGGAAAIPPSAATAASTASSLPQGNIWSKVMLTEDQHKKIVRCFCRSFLGKMVTSMMTPMGALTGGMIQGCCPSEKDASPEDLAKPADSAEGAAARIKKDEAEAKARRADIRYLGTADCSRYPEAEQALINGLRADPNECVRWEAALAFGNGCCCSKATVKALQMAASGSDKDGHPPERSPRVRDAAIYALSLCENMVSQTPEPPERPVPLPNGGPKASEVKHLEARHPKHSIPVPTHPSATAKTGPATSAPRAGSRGLVDLMLRAYATSDAGATPRRKIDPVPATASEDQPGTPMPAPAIKVSNDRAPTTIANVSTSTVARPEVVPASNRGALPPPRFPGDWSSSESVRPPVPVVRPLNVTVSDIPAVSSVPPAPIRINMSAYDTLPPRTTPSSPPPKKLLPPPPPMFPASARIAMPAAPVSDPVAVAPPMNTGAGAALTTAPAPSTVPQQPANNATLLRRLFGSRAPTSLVVPSVRFTDLDPPRGESPGRTPGQ